MLRTSFRSRRCRPAPREERARTTCYQGQSNDCYWHGLFGGIYIGHMRLATFEHLIAAEDLADAVAATSGRPPRSGRLADIDIDGVDEAIFEAPGQVVGVKLDAGAAIGEWDARAPRHALTAVMRRRPEASHRRLVEAAGSGRLKLTGPTDAEEKASACPTRAPRRPGRSNRSTRSSRHVSGDWRTASSTTIERRSGLARLFASSVTIDDLVRGAEGGRSRHPGPAI